MCIAILNSLNSRDISKKELLNCWNNNYDGAGLLWSNGTKLKTFKELKNFDVFYSEYQKARYESIGDVLIHFRIGTHGKIDKNNCHPFLVNKDLGFIHNGIMYDFGYEKDFSDTYVFNRDVLKVLPSNFLENDGVLNLIYIAIESSKLVFLDVNGKGTILNEKKGLWDDGNWFSNTSYKAINDYIDYGGTKVYKNKSIFDYQDDEVGCVCDSCLEPSIDLILHHEYNAFLCKTCSFYFK